MSHPIAIGIVAIALGVTPCYAEFVRSKAALKRFVSQQECPSTGEHRLPCPGYVIDHIKALACGGADEPINMQWQTREEAKAKDRWELEECHKGRWKHSAQFIKHGVDF